MMAWGLLGSLRAVLGWGAVAEGNGESFWGLEVVETEGAPCGVAGVVERDGESIPEEEREMGRFEKVSLLHTSLQ